MRAFIQRTVFGPNYRWWAVWVVALATFMSTTDSGLLSIILPVIMTDFNADLALAGWIMFIYALVTGSLYLPFGRLSDLMGRRKTFSAGFLLYAVGSAIAGLSQGPGQLILFRALQAVGSALMMANSFALVTALFPPEERGRAMGLTGGMVSALGHTLGPVLGGSIAHALGWRFVFYVTSVVGIVGFVAARLLLREEAGSAARGRKERFDLVGTSLFTVGLSCFLLAMTTGQRGSWNSPVVQGEFLLAVLALGLFIWWEARARFPLLDLRLFRILPFAAGNIARLANFIAISMNNLMMPFFLQLGLRMDPLKAGFLMTPTAAALAVLSPVSGWLSDRIGGKAPAMAGLALMGIACFSLSRLRLGASPLDIIVRLTLLGVGLGVFQTPNNNTLMSSIPRNRLGVGSSFLSVVRSFGQSVGVSMATAIVSGSLLAVTGQTSLQQLRGAGALEGNSLLRTAFMQGYRYTYLTAGFLCLAGVMAFLMRGSAERGGG